MLLRQSIMSAAQKTMMRDFNQQFFELQVKYWTPIDTDEYWDALTSDAMDLIGHFQSSDSVLNNFLSNIVVAFLNSREEMTV